LRERTRRINEQLNNRKFWESQLTAKVIAERAKAYKVWLFDPADKQWYSQEEFEDVFSKLFAGNPLFKRMQFKDPQEGITPSGASLSGKALKHNSDSATLYR